MKNYNGKNVKIIFKKEFEVGQEPEIADEIMDFALRGYKEFARHLKKPEKFWKDVLFAIKERIKDYE